MKEVHPVIVSASRRTDIPAFYMEDFLKKWRRGFTIWKNPFNPKQRRKVFFDKTKLVVFWSKYPVGYLKNIDKISFEHYMLYTINYYPKLEPKLPDLKKRIELFKEISRKIGKEKVIWRFDPIVLIRNIITPNDIVERFEVIANELSGFTFRVIVSFMTPYKKVLYRFKRMKMEYIPPTSDEVYYIAKKLGRISKKFGFEIQSCSEKFNSLGELEAFGIRRGACIDKDYIVRVFSENRELVSEVSKLRKDKGQRSLCLCVESADIGEYNTCKFDCIYCYAIMKRR